MRRIAVVAAATLAAALAACALGTGLGLAATRPHTARATPPSTAACYAFAVSALRRHVVVRRTPPACAGLGAARVNQAVGRAIHTVAGPLPKAAARRQDIADSRYLASLVRQPRPPRPASLAAAAAAAPGSVNARLAALAAWLAAAIAGARLLAGRLRRDARRRLRVEGGSLWLTGGHAALAMTGLCVWVGFVLTSALVVGWIDVAVSWIIVGLGMATLLSEGPVAQRVTADAAVTAGGTATVADSPPRAPVVMIALHGALATVTIVLVLLAVVSAG